METVAFIVNIIAIPALSPLSIGIIRKIKALMQNREGASILQPYRDLRKLFRKDEVISEDASWLFRAAPYLIFGSTLSLATAVPLVNSMAAFSPMGDLLVFVYTLAAGAFFLALAGMDTGSGFGGFGASREMMITALAEGGLVLSLAGASFIAGTANLAGMSLVLPALSGVALVPLVLLAAAFTIALLAENARYPVDNPATHLELTMVHEAMVLEYSGGRLALMEWASANKLLIFVVLLVNIFLPWGAASSPELSNLAGPVLFLALKVLLALCGVSVLESIIAKFRIFRVPDLLFTSFVLSVIAIVVIVV